MPLITLIVLALFMVAGFGAYADCSAGENPVGDKPYDPYEGIEPSGRIPRVDLPEEIERPERWRYVPEGRIKPGNIFQRFLVSTFMVPIFRYDQDVGAGFGVALTDIDFREKRRREFLGLFASYTTEGQQRYIARWRRSFYHLDLPGGGVAYEDRSGWSLDLGYERTLTRRFFGFGADTTADAETSYTDELFLASAGVEAALPGPGADIIGSAGLLGERHDLSHGRVSGRPSTDDVFPALVSDADGFAGLWLDVGLAYDTRDSQHSPYRGGRIAMDFSVLPLQSGHGVGSIYAISASRLFPVPGLFHTGGTEDEESPPTDTIAFGGFIVDSAGELPFFRLPTLGGRTTLRGYIQNRFTDRSAWHAGVEYRFWIVPRGFTFTPSIRIERLGLALFTEAGSVGNGLGELFNAEVLSSYGTSLRVSLERQAHFRLDLGFSDEGTNIVFAYGYSF